MYLLSKRERNDLFCAIMAGGLDPAECEYEHSSVENPIRISHVSSGSEFRLNVDAEPPYYALIYITHLHLGDELHWTERRYQAIGAATGALQEWAARVSEWVKTPDLWRISRSGSGVIPGELALNSFNTPFGREEKKAISDQLKVIAESIKETYHLTAEQSAKLDEKFEEAEKATERMGRKDWGLLFGGAVFSLILADIITPGVAGHILMMIEHGIGQLFAGGPPSVRGVQAG